jgi:hypothetical protein
MENSRAQRSFLKNPTSTVERCFDRILLEVSLLLNPDVAVLSRGVHNIESQSLSMARIEKSFEPAIVTPRSSCSQGNIRISVYLSHAWGFQGPFTRIILNDAQRINP